jgi:hypothetical protein
MGKLTPTYNDSVNGNGGIHAAPHTEERIKRPYVRKLKIEAVHEPLQSEAQLPPIQMPNAFLGTNSEQPAVVAPLPIAPAAESKPLKVALIGTAPSSRLLAPFNDPSWTIWCCSPGNQNVIPRVDAWFELHGNLMWPENKHYGEPYINWMKTLNIPLYMQDNSVIPNALSFPYKEMVAEFGDGFFTSSFAWMMAFAMKQGATEIALYGIDMASRDEYILQRPGFFFFRHEAEKRGIKVSAPHESDIMRSPGLYGYSEVTPFGRKVLARETELKARIVEMKNDPVHQRVQEIQRNITYLEGALEDIDYFRSIWIGQG